MIMSKLFNPRIDLVVLDVPRLEFIPELIPFLNECQCLSVFNNGVGIYAGPVSGTADAFTYDGLEYNLHITLEKCNLYPVISVITHVGYNYFHITSSQNPLVMPVDAKQYGTDLHNIFELISMLQIHDS